MLRLNVNEEYTGKQSTYDFSGTALFDGKTVAEVLEEIKEYAKDKGDNIGEGFGGLDKNSGHAWAIYINDCLYVSGWIGDKPNYHHQYDNELVKEISVRGGWYCFYDFHIRT